MIGRGTASVVAGAALIIVVACAGGPSRSGVENGDGQSVDAAAGDEPAAGHAAARQQGSAPDPEAPGQDAPEPVEPDVAVTAPVPEDTDPPATVPAPVIAEGVIEQEHAAASRARWVNNPTLWDGNPPTTFAVVGAPDEARMHALAARAVRRAFDGAPPIMGHSADFGGTLACLDCHGSGRAIGKRIAHPMSHQPMAQCRTCHVAPASGPFEEMAPTLDGATHFVGRASPGRGQRMFEGAPPTVPHPFTMRVRCLSCHGEFGYEGLRTDHPTRGQCIQCHVGQATVDFLAPTFGR